MVTVAVAGAVVLTVAGGSALRASLAALGHLDWVWLPAAMVAEASSMGAFARVQRRLLRAGGAKLRYNSVLAVTYAGNAISVSLPVAGAGMATAFSFRQFSRRGIEPAVAGWALAMSGIFSSFALGLMLTGGAVASGSATAATFGLLGAVVSVLPAVAVLAALHSQAARHLLTRVTALIARFAGRLVRQPDIDAGQALELFLNRVARLGLPRLQYVEVLALSIWNWVAGCLCLAAAMRATGSNVPWHGLFLAYGAAMTAASIGVTPGGLGVIEVTLSAALVAAGMTGHRALAAVVVYRLVSFWLVMAAGWIVMAVLARIGRRARSQGTDALDGESATIANLRPDPDKHRGRERPARQVRTPKASRLANRDPGPPHRRPRKPSQLWRPGSARCGDQRKPPRRRAVWHQRGHGRRPPGQVLRRAVRDAVADVVI